MLATILLACGTLLQPATAAVVTGPPVEPTTVVPAEIAWLPMPQFADGRERALLSGRPEAGGDWTYRLRVSLPIRVAPHTHPVDEYITVLAGRWSFGVGRVFDEAQLVAFPPGSFVVIPAGTPHFVAVDTPGTVIQSSGSGVFATHPVD